MGLKDRPARSFPTVACQMYCTKRKKHPGARKSCYKCWCGKPQSSSDADGKKLWHVNSQISIAYIYYICHLSIVFVLFSSRIGQYPTQKIAFACHEANLRKFFSHYKQKDKWHLKISKASRNCESHHFQISILKPPGCVKNS